MRERRSISENAALNLTVVRGVMAVAVVLSSGWVALSFYEKPVPSDFSNIILAIVSGLIGYLARDPKQQSHSSVNASDAGTVNVDAGDGSVEVTTDQPAGNAPTPPPSTPIPGSVAEDRTRRLPDLGKGLGRG